MQIIKINPKNYSPKAIKIAARVIKNGGVIIYPTDTIYGIGASALDQNAIDKVYRIKQRPDNKPLSVIVRDIKMAKKYCIIEKNKEEIFSALLPGPFTLIFKANKLANEKIFTIYKNTLSVRIPDFKITKLLSKELAFPFTSTSANISGKPGSGDIIEVLKQIGINKKNPNLSRMLGIDLVLDAGVLLKKNPSTIIDLTGKRPKIIRK